VDVTFIEQNILETADLNQQFDIIVSNPPYVRNLETRNENAIKTPQPCHGSTINN
jgi:methylase of polypeptide subunit release factors